MRPSDLLSTIRNIIFPLKQPMLIWGQPGIGKSDIVRQAASMIGGEFIDIRGSLLDPVDLRGIPMIDMVKKMTHWARPIFIPAEGRGIIFLDEVGQAPTSTQAAMLQLCLDRQVGEARIGDEWAVIAASNRAEDRAGANRLISPLLNRFVHIELEVSNDDWHAWAVENGIAPEVRSFLKFRPKELNTFDASKDAGVKAYATPRSWSFVSKMFKSTPPSLRASLFGGAVGTGTAAEFAGFLAYYEQLPNLQSIIDNPSKAPIPHEPAVMWALCAALPDHLRSARMKHDNAKGKDAAAKDALAELTKIGKAIITYALRINEDDFSVMLGRDSLAAWVSIRETPEFKMWREKHKDVLFSTLDVKGAS